MDTLRFSLSFCLAFVYVKSQAEFGFYYGYKQKVTHDEAQSACASLGLRLAIMEDESKWNRAKEYVQQYDVTLNSDGDHFWIGLKYDTITGQHTWWDGSPLTFDTAWKNGEPKDVVTKPCARVEHSGNLEWESKSCSETRDYLCEGFLYMTSTKTWTDAKSDCENNGAKLSSLKTINQWEAAAQHLYLMNYLLGISGYDVYIGLEYVSQTSQFTFVDGTLYYPPNSIGVLPWDSSEPNNIGNENCVRMKYESSGTYKWRTVTCSDTYRYICTMSVAAWTSLPQTTTSSTVTSMTTSTTTTTPTTTIPTTTTTTTTTSSSTTTTTQTGVAPTKPWWWVEYGADGLAIGQNGLSFKESRPEVKSGIIGLAIGFATFFIVTITICVCWLRCCKKHADKLISAEENESDKKDVKVFDEGVFVPSSEIKYHP